MADAKQVAALIARLEAATGADRELDAAIAGTDAATVQWHGDEETPRYTASIDSALMLVPEGWRPTISHHTVPDDRWLVHLRFWEKQQIARAPLPALAICIAALRAKGGE